MEKLLSSIPVYNLLTNLIPGTVLASLLKLCIEECDIFKFTTNIWILTVILYFLGVINSRISSLVIEPLLKKVKFIQFVSHKDYTDAELREKGDKLIQLSRMNNEYRSYISIFCIVLIIKLIFLCPSIKTFTIEYSSWLFIGIGLVLFFFAYKKQISYIKSRVDRLTNNSLQ